ncbi:MAG TPA: DUF433 domain-containing protein [Gemmatimonadaceae bacterium]|nr:DUF433 domain-containing protein [Gemmatimonadaceae bacterium]
MAQSISPVIHSDPEVLSGTAVFVGTRAPFQALIDCLEGGYALSELLEDFPSVSNAQMVAALDLARDAVLARLPAASRPPLVRILRDECLPWGLAARAARALRWLP